MKVEAARRAALKLIGEMADGRDPVAQRRGAEAAAVTLNEVFEIYLRERKLKPNSVRIYRGIIASAFADWRCKKLQGIHRDMVVERHIKLTEGNGPAYANLAMRFLGALFAFAGGKYEDDEGRSFFPQNPVKRLSQIKRWNRIERRQTVIHEHDLKAWYVAVETVRERGGFDATVADFLTLVLFTGLRKNEAAGLRWTEIDFPARTLTVPAERTKNARAHTLPLPTFVMDLLDRRRAEMGGEWVFPGQGIRGRIVDPTRVMARVTELSQVSFRLHDLRRTFATTAESLDIPAFALKRLLNHSGAGDVTAGYTVITTNRLRKPMEVIADYLLKAMGVEPSAAIVTLERPHATR